MIVAILSFFASAFIEEKNSWLKAEQSKFIGTWGISNSEYYYSYSSSSKTIWTFYENKTLKITTYYNYYDQGYYNPIITFNKDTSNNTLIVTNIAESEYLTSSVKFGSYKLENGKLYIKENRYDDSYQNYNYRFSENNSKLYLSYYYSSSTTKTLTKTSESIISSTVKWENINITISGSSIIHYDWINLTRSSVSYYGSHAPSAWGNVTIGDVIQLGEYSFDIYVTFEWISSDEVIDAWYFLVYSQPASTDPVVYLDFNEDTGNIAFDKSGNGNYGTVHGAIRITGVSGQALSFDGINDWVEIKDNDTLELTEDFTIACWLYKSSSSYSSYSDYIFLSKHTPHLNKDYSWWLAISDRKLGFSSYPGSFVSGDQIIDSNTWLYVVITFDDSTNNFNIYIDGELDNQIEYNLDVRANNKMVSIGAEDGQNAFFGGFIDEFRIYNSVLSQDEIQKLYNDIISSKTFYVGGIGPGNYSKIQDALDAADYGNTVYVYSGVYKENLMIDNSINLIGENKNTTIIDGSEAEAVVEITADHVNISEFTVKNSSYHPGIFVYSSHNNIFNCDISDSDGIRLSDYSNNNTISSNQIHNNTSTGIHLLLSNNNTIRSNQIYNNFQGIQILHSKNNAITTNQIYNNNYCSILLYNSTSNTIITNQIHNNTGWGVGAYGISLENSSNNIIYHNNFIDNTENSSWDLLGTNTWYNKILQEGNYWDDYVGTDNDEDGIGDTPYIINGGINQDKYPLMNPIDI